uniref:Uncharacterized protein n=1 Tax=Arundo donax TaxID=35708 RepID=A0A0A8ZEP1_ARUDO
MPDCTRRENKNQLTHCSSKTVTPNCKIFFLF